MILKYLDGERKVIEYPKNKFWMFNPVGEVPDQVGERILAFNVSSIGRFERVAEPHVVETVPPIGDLKCDQCEKVFKSKAALGSHKRTHKEQAT